jgi:hypothetical protein
VFHEVGAEAAAFADPRDPVAWSREIERIVGHPEERERMRQAGMARAAELTYVRTAEATLAVLREAAGLSCSGEGPPPVRLGAHPPAGVGTRPEDAA